MRNLRLFEESKPSSGGMKKPPPRRARSRPRPGPHDAEVRLALHRHRLLDEALTERLERDAA